MKNRNSLHELYEQVTRQIIDERNQEMAVLIEEKRRLAENAQAQYRTGIDTINGVGLNLSSLEALDLELSATSDKELLSIETQMDEQSQQPLPTTELDIEGALLPEGAKQLTPGWLAAFSDDKAQDPLTEATTITPQTIIGGGACKNYFNWAKGKGSGLWGTGAGKIQSWIDFGFWFKPNATRYYNVRPLFRLRGYVIVKANDGVFTSKWAEIKVTARINVYQYNWKGWHSVTLHNERGANININHRVDIDQHTQSSYLLAGGDWAFIRCSIGLYAYARGGGSYAKNDFATGSANYLCVPHVHVF